MTSGLPLIVEKLIPRLASNFDGEGLAAPRSNHTQLAACSYCMAETLAEFQRYPNNNAVALKCLTCNNIVRQGGKLFIPHSELRAAGIDPRALPEVSR